MSKSFRYELSEARFLVRKYNELVRIKDRVVSRNSKIEMEQWSDADLVVLRDALIEMAAIRKRQSEHHKIMAADVVLIMIKRETP